MKEAKQKKIERLVRQKAIEACVLERYPYIKEEQTCSTTKWFRDKMREEYREKIEKFVSGFIKVTPEMLKPL